MEKCSFHRCARKCRKHYIKAFDLYLCDYHWECFKDLSLMPLRNRIDWKKQYEAEYMFWKHCKAKTDHFKSMKYNLDNNKYAYNISFDNNFEYDEKLMKYIQKDILNKIGCKHIKIWPKITEEDRIEAQKTGKKLKDAKYDRIKCEWCGAQIPSNGAAQFSHLKKHVKELVESKIISESLASEIKKLKLKPNIRKIFEKNFNESK